MKYTQPTSVNPSNASSILDDAFRAYTSFPSLPLYISNVNLSDFPSMRSTPHTNESMIMVYIRKGRLAICVNGKREVLEEACFCVIDANCLHFFESINGEDCNFVYTIVSEVLFSTTDRMYNKYVSPFFHSYHPDISIIKKDNEYYDKLIRIGHGIFDLIKDKPVAYELSIVGFLYGILAVLYKSLNEKFFLSSKVVTKNDEAINKIIAFIKQNIKESFDIEDLCAVANVSRTKCFQLFKQYTGDTPSVYIMNYRLTISKNYLIHTSLSIAEISNICGFAHQSHFTSCFSKKYHITPLQFRKSVKAKFLESR